MPSSFYVSASVAVRTNQPHVASLQDVSKIEIHGHKSSNSLKGQDAEWNFSTTKLGLNGQH